MYNSFYLHIMFTTLILHNVSLTSFAHWKTTEELIYYLHCYIPKPPASLSTANTDHILFAAATYDVITTVKIIRAGVIAAAIFWSDVKLQMKSPIHC